MHIFTQKLQHAYKMYICLCLLSTRRHSTNGSPENPIAQLQIAL